MFVITLKPALSMLLGHIVRLVLQPGLLLSITFASILTIKDALLAQHNRDLDPSTVQEAMRRHDWPELKAAMDDELASFYKLEVWEYTKLPPKANLIKCKWIFLRKYDADGMLKKYKARLVAKGFSQQFGVDYHGTFAPTVTLNAVCVLMAITNDKFLHLHSIDVKTAFLMHHLRRSATWPFLMELCLLSVKESIAFS